MSKKLSDSEWIKGFFEAAPGGDDWSALAGEVPARMSGLEEEDQVRVAERLASQAAEDGVSEILEKLYNQKGVVLAALIAIAKALRGQGSAPDDDLIRTMEQWAVVCEEGESECGPDEFFMLPENLQNAVLDHLARWLRADVISTLKDAASDKKQAKLPAKALHRVRSAGAAAAEQGPARFVMRERDEYVEEAYLSPPDYMGTSMLYLYKTVFGKSSLFVVIINDVDGVLRFEGFRVPLPRFRKMLDSTRKNPHAIIARVEPGFVLRLIRSSEEQGRRHGKSQDEEYLRNRRAIGVVDEPDAPHPVWSVMNAEELKIERGLVFRGAELLDHRMFADWNLMPVEEGRFLAEFEKLKHSLIELSEKQQQERENDLLEKEAKAVLEFIGRKVWRDRLLNCAYLLHLIGEDENARIIAANALAVLKDQEPAPPLFTAMIRRSVEKVSSDKDDDGGGQGPDMDRGGIVVV